jgi:hypothetical protein
VKWLGSKQRLQTKQITHNTFVKQPFGFQICRINSKTMKKLRQYHSAADAEVSFEASAEDDIDAPVMMRVIYGTFWV